MPKYVILTDFLDFRVFLSILAEPQLINKYFYILGLSNRPASFQTIKLIYSKC
jgi:hypothetical protein